VEERRALAEQVVRLGAPLALARDSHLARELGAVLVHDPDEILSGLPFSLPVHDEAEARAASIQGPALVFVSPVYPTRTHPGAPALGLGEAARLAALAGRPAIALGGMDSDKGEVMMMQGFAGWAGIDCWLRT
jgi:thiamine-phosphate pyrophosphorylase